VDQRAPGPGVRRGRDRTWLVTTPVPGLSAVHPRWLAEPRRAVAAVGEGLRALHDTLPVDRCPFTWSAADRVRTAYRRVAAGLAAPPRWHAEQTGLTAAQALAVLADVPEVDRTVVCHGDSCGPNTIVGADGRWSGHVDLGSLGVADRWADLAVAAWSTGRNYRPGWEQLLLDAYGVPADPERTRWYHLLYDLDE